MRGRHAPRQGAASPNPTLTPTLTLTLTLTLTKARLTRTLTPTLTRTLTRTLILTLTPTLTLAKARLESIVLHLLHPDELSARVAAHLLRAPYAHLSAPRAARGFELNAQMTRLLVGDELGDAPRPAL